MKKDNSLSEIIKEYYDLCKSWGHSDAANYFRDQLEEYFQKHVDVLVQKKISSLNQEDVDSMFMRIFNIVTTDFLYNGVERESECNSILKSCDSYSIMYANDQRSEIARYIDSEKQECAIIISITTGIVYLERTRHKMSGKKEECFTAVYALAGRNNVSKKKKGTRRELVPSSDGALIDYGVFCSRFDPSSSTGKAHDNLFKIERYNGKYENILEGEELKLYKKYFKESAPCPHFHYFSKKLCAATGKTMSSYAINTQDLEQYLSDLMEVYSSQQQNSPLLQYDLGMPYLDMLKKNIIFSPTDFLTDMKSTLKKYNTTADNQAVQKVLEMVQNFEERVSQVKGETLQNLKRAFETLSIFNESISFLSIEDQMRLARKFSGAGGGNVNVLAPQDLDSGSGESGNDSFSNDC